MTRTNEILQQLKLMHKEGDYYSMSAEQLKTELKQLRTELENRVWDNAIEEYKGLVENERYIMYLSDKGTAYSPLSRIPNKTLFNLDIQLGGN